VAIKSEYVPSGVIPAVLLPFHEDLSIDEASYRAHLRDVTAVPGLSAITVNAHASEVASCTFDEQRRVLEISREELGTLPIIHGVYADGSLEAARIAAMATAGGASALLVFPPNIYYFGQRPEMAVEHFKRIADASDLPLVAFQYPLAGGYGYPLATLERIVDEVPSVRAIKDWCANPQLHERHIRLLQSRPRPVNVLTTHSSWLLSSLALGCAGLLSGSGSVIADLQAQLFRAVQAGNLEEAKRVHERITPTAEVFYAEPWVDMHNRMKEALVLLGKLPRAVVRPPLVKLPAAEIERIRAALAAAGLPHKTPSQRREPSWVA
jgi:4-hydroxy-tetrahydrodipicolinate synthase